MLHEELDLDRMSPSPLVDEISTDVLTGSFEVEKACESGRFLGSGLGLSKQKTPIGRVKTKRTASAARQRLGDCVETWCMLDHPLSGLARDTAPGVPTAGTREERNGIRISSDMRGTRQLENLLIENRH